MIEQPSPYKRHIFVCVNTKEQGTFCSQKESVEIAASLKEAVKKKGLQASIRVTKTQCQGLCSQGVNIHIYPENIWVSELSKEDVPSFIEKWIHP